MEPSFSNLTLAQRQFFAAGETRDIGFRKQQLQKLRRSIENNEKVILEALRNDLGRSDFESFSAEIAIVFHEIDKARRKLKSWARRRRQATPLVLFPATSWIEPEPYGRVLIIAPWNYPFQLALAPLVAAIAAGNCAVVKPSEAAPATAKVIGEIIADTFDPAFVRAIEGGVAETQALLAEPYDFIFFTGGTRIGKLVYEAAARHLTPVVLELGGKNPCIVEPDADLAVAARRIAWGKCINAGQTCIAPDYLLVHRSIQERLIDLLAGEFLRFYGDDPKTSGDYGRIVNDAHFTRLNDLLTDGVVVAGGETDPNERYIAPTILDGITWDSKIMRDEIFGPILPVIVYDHLDQVLAEIGARPKPLALYLFSGNEATQRKVLGSISSGGAAINDVFAQILNLELPFGGVGESGIGAYHGKSGFDTFSHLKSVVKRGTWADPRLKYPPYRLPIFVMRWLTRLLF